MQISKSYNLKDFAINIVVLILYLLIAKLSLVFSITEIGVTIFWPAGGFALAILLITGLKYLPGIFVGAVAAGLLMGGTLSFSVLSALGNTLETYCAYWLLTYLRPIDRSLTHRQDFFNLLLYGAVISTLISASIGSVSLVALNLVELSLLPEIALRWWMGDSIGIAFMTPIILIWAHCKLQPLSKTINLELIALFALSFVTGQIVFFHWLEISAGHYDISWIFLFIVWSATRFKQHDTALLQLMFFIQALLSASQGVGHYANSMQETGLVNFWGFGMMTAIGGMTLAIMTTEKNKVMNELRNTAQRLADAIWGAGVDR